MITITVKHGDQTQTFAHYPITTHGLPVHELETANKTEREALTTLIIKQIPGLERATNSGDWSFKDNANGTIVAPHHVRAYVTDCTDDDGNGPEFTISISDNSNALVPYDDSSQPANPERNILFGTDGRKRAVKPEREQEHGRVLNQSIRAVLQDFGEHDEYGALLPFKEQDQNLIYSVLRKRRELENLNLDKLKWRKRAQKRCSNTRKEFNERTGKMDHDALERQAERHKEKDRVRNLHARQQQALAAKDNALFMQNVSHRVTETNVRGTGLPSHDPSKHAYIPTDVSGLNDCGLERPPHTANFHFRTAKREIANLAPAIYC